MWTSTELEISCHINLKFVAIGYRVSSGFFIGHGLEWVVASAPRYENKGKVGMKSNDTI